MVVYVIPKPFTDIKEILYFYYYILNLYERGIIKGMTSTTFSSGATLTRAQTVVLFYRLMGSPSVSEAAPFTDVDPNKWYSDAIALAQDVAIINGMSKTAFEPLLYCTRAQAVKMLCLFELLE